MSRVQAMLSAPPLVAAVPGTRRGISFAFPCFWVSSALRQGTGGGSPASGRVWTAMLRGQKSLPREEVSVYDLWFSS